MAYDYRKGRARARNVNIFAIAWCCFAVGWEIYAPSKFLYPLFLVSNLVCLLFGIWTLVYFERRYRKLASFERSRTPVDSNTHFKMRL